MSPVILAPGPLAAPSLLPGHVTAVPLLLAVLIVWAVLWWGSVRRG